ncbi:hypothetical protein EZV62_023456 [Acer yangbiense]|uniref:Zinc knuckle CX2CX4HX4C domain-containing protein n=1 Tax=Acer yangbiense TaxID=1000413 RepID=A0A5C7H377_9ROSI|nr:hypothetical protein EZV62_023456 [Acer yangbiense]
MDQEEIARLCASLSLKSKQEKLWSVRETLKDSVGKKIDLCLVGKGDRFQVLSGGPWVFDNSLLVLEKSSGLGNVASLAFNRVAFWIQIPNAPLMCMTKEMGEFIGQLIGDLKDIDVGSTWECFGKYMRLRVELDVSKPLKRFLRLELEKGKESISLLRYEKLPEYCYHCAIVGHSYQEYG